MDSTPIVDSLGRTPIAEGMKRQIDAQFTALASDKRGAILVMANEQGATAHLAARINGHWKVAGGAGWAWTEKRPSGWCAVELAW